MNTYEITYYPNEPEHLRDLKRSRTCLAQTLESALEMFKGNITNAGTIISIQLISTDVLIQPPQSR